MRPHNFYSNNTLLGTLFNSMYIICTYLSCCRTDSKMTSKRADLSEVLRSFPAGNVMSRLCKAGGSSGSFQFTAQHEAGRVVDLLSNKEMTRLIYSLGVQLWLLLL